MTATTLNGQIIGQAERSTRAVLDRLLATTGTTFDQWVAINLAATTAPAGPDELAAGLTTGLQLDPAAAAAVIRDLAAAGLLSPQAALTPAGRRRHQEISAGIAAITERLYGGLPADELATAGRVLATVTERARDELRSA
jgi:DNA-binding MarR family transcriptional regulator